ncbi:MAG: FAD-dependent oxidoreductase, partial [Actinobacteria bacterium]|nr:FAD-dependent oxidoreductase [Actinomycetota bacterium]
LAGLVALLAGLVALFRNRRPAPPAFGFARTIPIDHTPNYVRYHWVAPDLGAHDESGQDITQTITKPPEPQGSQQVAVSLAGIQFDPPLPALRDALTQRFPMGATTKFHVLYDRAFWRDNGFSRNLWERYVSVAVSPQWTFRALSPPPHINPQLRGLIQMSLSSPESRRAARKTGRGSHRRSGRLCPLA